MNPQASSTNPQAARHEQETRHRKGMVLQGPGIASGKTPCLTQSSYVELSTGTSSAMGTFDRTSSHKLQTSLQQPTKDLVAQARGLWHCPPPKQAGALSSKEGLSPLLNTSKWWELSVRQAESYDICQLNLVPKLKLTWYQHLEICRYDHVHKVLIEEHKNLPT